MKNISSIILGATLLCAAPACTDLSETVYDTIPSDQFGQTQEQINAVIAPIYSTFRSLFPGDFFVFEEETGDMAITPTRVGGDWWDGGYHMEGTRRTWTYMNSMIGGMWNSCMSGISTCNMIYFTIDKAENMDADLKAQTLAEIRGVRAFWIYKLIDNFGNAPLAQNFESTELPSVSSRQELFKFAVAELNGVKDLLRDDVTSGSAYGKFTKGAALAILAKLYLNAEEWTGTPMWQEAADACDATMALGYIIEPNWKTNFSVQNEVSKEAILALCFSKENGGNYLHNRTLHYKDPIALGFTKGTWNGISANPEYVKLFDPADKRFEGSFLMGEMIDPATGKVLITDHGRELNHTIDINVFSQDKYDNQWGEANQEDGARCNKWVFEAGMNNTDMENDFHIFRLADIYLMKAEALVRMGKDNAEATRLVNVIRERGYGNADANYTDVDLDKIYLERRLELAWESFSRQDRIRFGKFSEPGFLRTETTEDYRKLFPIPFSAWQTNNKLEQNPGYPAF